MSILLRFFVVLFLLYFFTTNVFANEQKHVNDPVNHHPLILKDSGKQPAWMKTWTLARKERRASNSSLAIKLYHQLLQEKPNIEEALREYSLLLMDEKKWKTSSSVLQKLLEINPDSQEYLFHSGRIALHLKQYNRAATNFGQVYTVDPNGPNAINALRGQIEALQKQGHLELAYPLMEQLYLLVPHEETSIRTLAEYSIKLGQNEKGRNYYKTLLNEFKASDNDFLKSERLFADVSDIDMASKCWQGYLISHPFYIPFHKNLSSYYLQSGQEKKALDHLLILVAHGDNRASSYLQIGQIYLYELGRPDKALYYYDEYRKRIQKTGKVEKEIQRIQAILANDLLVIVENEGAWNLWRDLARVIPDRLAVYYSMADQLKSLGKPKELREVLDIIHFHNPEDQDILLQLAQLTFDEHDYSASLRALDSLNSTYKNGSLYYSLHAKISEIYGHLTEALQYYSSYIEIIKNDSDTMLHAMQLAGTLGHKEQLSVFHQLSQGVEKTVESKKAANLLYGKILLENSLYTTARTFYSYFATTLERDDPYQPIIQEHLAEISHREGNYFEAEQEFRFLLLKEPENQDYLSKLVQNALRAKDWTTAWEWHEIREEKVKKLSEVVDSVELELIIEKITILSESDQNDVAIDWAEDFLSKRPDSRNLKLVLAGLYYKKGLYLNAQELLTSIVDKTTEEDLLLSIIEKKSRIVQSVEQGNQRSVSSLLRAQQYYKYGANKQALDSVNDYLKLFESSIKGRMLKIQILQSSGNYFAAMGILKELSRQYPLEDYFQEQSIKIFFSSSKFENIIQILDADTQPGQKGNPQFTKYNVLLLARSYWAQKKQKKALAIYEEFLQTPVDLLFAKKLNEKQITIKIQKAERSLLNKVTFTKPVEPNRLRIVMSPKYTINNIDSPEVEIITSLYAEYRWQELIQEELSVRKEMNGGNYYQAMKDYQRMLGHNPSMESLFDLAGIYSQLGFLGKEAALYQTIQEKSPGYPYLDEAMQRNKLKRKPKLSVEYELKKREGNEGYFDNKQQATGINVWYMPNLTQVLTVNYRRIYNESLDKKQDLWRNRIIAEMEWSPSYDLEFLALIGLDSGEAVGQSTLLYDFEVKGKLGDMAEGFFNVSEDVVDDTVEALKRSISAVKYEAGIQVDILPRLFAGGTYNYIDYSDANYQNRYQVWSAYILHHEPLLLQLRYDYDLSHNSSGNKIKEFKLTGVYGPGDHPYWSQKEYWQHQFSVFFEHQLTDDILGRGAPSYYSLGYTFGYEEGGYGNHQFKAQIFLEISRHFLLNSSFNYTNGAEFEKLDSNISLIYRW